MSTNVDTLADLVNTWSSQKKALVLPDSGLTLSYNQLKDQVNALMKLLSSVKLQRSDHVVAALPNGLEFITTFLATTALGLVFVPVNPALTEEELSFLTKNCNASAVILKPGEHSLKQVAKAQGIAIGEIQINADGQVHVDFSLPTGLHFATGKNISEDDIALMLYTSGTTNHPKGVPLTHKNILASIKNFTTAFSLTENDTSMVVMPLFHVHGLIGAMLSTLFSHGTVVLPPRFSASSFWQQVTTHLVTWYSASPTIHHILLSQLNSHQAPYQQLRFVRSSSAKLAPSVLKQLEELFGTVVLEGYGMTEAANQISANPLPPAKRKLGSVGIANGIEISILSENGYELPNGSQGEICIRGPSVMHGYHKLKEVNDQSYTGAWFRTGDLGYFDNDDYLYVNGRIKDLIIRGGENISPHEVDAVLLEHPAVAEAISFGVPDLKYGEEINAAVVLKYEATEDDLISFCHNRLAGFKVPKKIYITKDFPRTATNKIQRKLVAAQFVSTRF